MENDIKKELGELREQIAILKEDAAATTLMFQNKLHRECEKAGKEAVKSFVYELKKQLEVKPSLFEIQNDEFYKAKQTVITPAFTENSINVCLSADENFAIALGVTLSSLIGCSSVDKNYDLIIMTSDISERHRREISALSEERENISIRFVNMKPLVSAVTSSALDYRSAETNFRFFLSEPLFAEYKRMIWLDCDTVVVSDIAELFDTSLDGFSIGATRDYSVEYQLRSRGGYTRGSKTYSRKTMLTEFLGLKGTDKFFNAGVILFDLERFREKASLKTLMELVNSREAALNDEEVLNILFEDDTKLIDNRFNCLIIYEPMLREGGYSDIATEKMKSALAAPCVVHYVGKGKPWLSPSCTLKSCFWEAARKTMWHEELICSLILARAQAVVDSRIEFVKK